MKRIFFIFIIIMMSCNESENRYQNCTKSELAISTNIVPHFNSFIEDCKVYDVNYDHAYCLKYIRFARSNSWQGQTDLENGTIEINQGLIDDSIGMKFVIYHELGHWYGLDHSDGIMKVNYNSSDIKWIQENWEQLLKEHLQKIKNL